MQIIISKFFLIPQRLILGIMGFLSLVVSYTLRASLSLAITQMVIKHKNKHGQAECAVPSLLVNSTDQIPTHGEFDWSEELQGIILSAFFWGYIITHFPAGALSVKYGGKMILLAGMGLATIANLLTPVLLYSSGSTALIVLRVIIGVGQGVVFPANTALLAAWTPLKERSIMCTLVYSGALIGSIIGTYSSGLLLTYYRWPAVFYFFGTVSIVWMILFAMLCYNNPESHPFISEQEREFLRKELSGLKRNTDLPPTPWKTLFTSPPVLALIAAQFGHNWGFFIVTSDLPKYMSDVMDFSIKENGIYSSLPYLVMWLVGLAAGFISDFMISRKYIDITFSRKLYTFIATIGPGAFLVGVSYAGCNRTAVIVLFTLGMGIMGPFYSGHKANSIDLSPNYAGVIQGITNGIGALAGMFGPSAVGIIAKNRLISEWRIVFWIAFGVFAITTIIFIIWGTAEVQPWNDPKANDEKESKKDSTKSSDRQVNTK